MKIRLTIWVVSLFLIACNNPKSNEQKGETTVTNDTLPATTTPEVQKQTEKEFSNERFREVTVEKVDENTYRVQGEAQVFEANFGWVIEDGHNELKKGFSTTQAGAPEWGKFDFTVEAPKTDENATYHIILFEVSAKDGTRQSELPIPLQ